MSDTLANDVRRQFERSFNTIKKIVETFPEDKWLIPHGDEYYIPSRIAYHIAEYIDGMVAGRFMEPGFRENLPFGSWFEGTAETLPGKDALLQYLKESVTRADAVLAALDDEAVTAPLPQEMSRMGASKISAHMSALREIAAHTGEINKMLVENGIDDIWL